MGKSWSYLFAAVMIACGALIVAAPMVGWWLPLPAASHVESIDRLFYIILAITGFFFVLTEGLLVVFMYQYAARPEGQEHVFGHDADAQKVLWTSTFKKLFRPVSALLHDQHRVELAWTLVPAVILLYIAFAQVKTWADVKYESRMPQFAGSQKPIQIDLSARQFEWRFRYASAKRMEDWINGGDNPEYTTNDYNSFAKVPQKDDVHLVNELHTWKGQPTIIQLTTRDVIHSFNMPNMRIKQDALPGKVIPVWFTPTIANTWFNPKSNQFEDAVNPKSGESAPQLEFNIACAELCGWGHYRMIGKVYVHESQDDFLNWLRFAEANAHRHTP